MFYNVENLFDTEDDPQIIDEEFLPQSIRHWDEYKFYTKLNRIFQVIMAAGEGNHPALIGMCEIENHKVLESLLHFTPLGKMGYAFIHKESPDRRGIDVALLYRKDKFHPILYDAFPVKNLKDIDFKTRDILYVKGKMASDTFYVFVNHWPSKYGGVVESKPLRALAAKTLRSHVDSLMSTPKRKVIVMGDFNDSPFDESLTKHLQCETSFDSISYHKLYNLAFTLGQTGTGSNKYHGKWEMIDQILVSGALLKDEGLNTDKTQFKVFKKDFLLEKDKNYLGLKPKRTYVGMKYNNGFSDHLPVLLDIN